MKPKLLILIGLFAVSAIVSSAQCDGITVEPEKIIYNRSDEDVPDLKKTFEVRTPTFPDIEDENLRAEFRNTFDPWKVFGFDLKENLTGYHWLMSFDYEVHYNKKPILGIALLVEGYGAYPSGGARHIVIDTRTGQQVLFGDLFQNVSILRSELRKAQLLEEQAAVKNDEDRELHGALKFYKSEPKDSDFDQFHVTNRGVVFFYEYGFAHIVKALEPAGEYFFDWNFLREYIKKDGLLGKFYVKPHPKNHESKKN